MNQIGNKIRKIRELKNIAPKDMADRLNMTPQGYQRIERDEVGVNVERLLEIAKIFEMKPEEVLTFDEKVIFSHNTITDNGTGINYGPTHFNTFPEEMKKLYEDKITLLEEKIQWMAEKIKAMENRS